MGAYSGPEITNDSLIFHYDMENTDKSFKGKPTTNLSATGGKFFDGNNNFTTDETIQDILPDGTIGDVRYLKADYVVDVNRTVSVGNYNLDAGQTYTLSFYVKNINCTGFGGNLYSPGLGRVIGAISYPTIYTDRWTRVIKTFTVPDEGVDPVTVSPQAFRDGGYGFFKMSWLQLEEGSIASAYSNGTRSNTEAILDLTGTNTITATNLSYNSDNTFEFDGTDDYLTIPRNWHHDEFTIELVVEMFSFSNSSICFNVQGQGLYPRVSCGGNVFTQYRIDGSTVGLNSNSSVSLNTPFHYVFTHDPSVGGKAYLNGNLDASNSVTGNHDGNTGGNMLLGHDTNLSRYGNHKLYQFKLYSRALTPNEVKNNYLATKSRYGL
jgi:hypothetical protein